MELGLPEKLKRKLDIIIVYEKTRVRIKRARLHKHTKEARVGTESKI